MANKLKLVPSKPDNRDYKFLATVAPLPATDLRPFCPPIRNQATEGSCVEFDVLGAVEILMSRFGQYQQLAEQFLYWTTLHAEGRDGQEGTVSIRDCLETLRKTGVCLESEWPYTLSDEHTRPSDAAFASAASRKLVRYAGIDISRSILAAPNQQLGIDNINSALAANMPVCIALALGSRFYSIHGPLLSQVGQYYPVDFPGTANDGTNPYIGAHGLSIAGNISSIRCWIVRNQWDITWGDGGYALLPYDCIRDFSEAWVITHFMGIDVVDPAVDLHQRQLAAVYVATLGRAPELDGFLWWMGQSSVGNMAACAEAFVTSAECTTKFGSPGGAVANTIYNLALIANQVEVATYFVVDMCCNRSDYAARALIGVTADPASVEPAKLAIRQMIHDGPL